MTAVSQPASSFATQDEPPPFVADDAEAVVACHAEADLGSPFRIYLINLDRAPERLAFMAAQLERLNLPFTRFPAVDGRAAGLARQPERPWYRSLSPGERGCYESHRAIWSDMVARQIPRALVIEDDVELGAQLPMVLRDIAGYDFDFIRLACIRSQPNRLVRRSDTVEIVENTRFSKNSGTGAYAVTLRGARRMLRRAEPPLFPIDNYMDRAWTHGARSLQVSPLCVTQTARFGSDVDPGGSNGRIKRRSLGERFGQEARRFVDWVAWARHRVWTRLGELRSCRREAVVARRAEGQTGG